MPTLEAVAAAQILRAHLPALRVRVVNVVDLLALLPPSLHPHGLPDEAFDALFTRNRPVIFAYHGYAALIHRLVYRRTNHAGFHVRGYREEGTTTTPFDMVVRNELDRFHLVLEVVRRCGGLGRRGAVLAGDMERRLALHARHIRETGTDRPEVRGWRWEGSTGE